MKWTCAVILLGISCTTGWKTGSGGTRRTQTHSYPSSTGYSGTGTGGSHTYPKTTGYSGNRGASGTSYHTVNNHYHYHPPQQINYGSGTHPVYHGRPPTYIYEYRNSGSRFDTLLTGLALYNLGRMSSGHGYDGYGSSRHRSDEICKLGISKSNGDYEETRVNCQLLTSFIWDAERETTDTNPVRTETNVTFVTTVINGTESVTVTNSTLVEEAVNVKGPSMKVTSDMKCFLMRTSRDRSVMKKHVDCGLLQTYATQSMYAAAFTCNRNTHLIILMLCLYLLRYY